MPLSTEKINTIEQETRDILVDLENKKGELELPINLGKILEEHGITLKMGDLDNGISGAYDKNSKTIVITEKDSYERKAFTVAHELGHYFLHKNKEQEIFKRKSTTDLDMDNFKKEEEQEANWFAASLLMPKELILKYWGTLQDIHTMAQIFSVSSIAMENRLKNLNFLQ